MLNLLRKNISCEWIALPLPAPRRALISSLLLAGGALGAGPALAEISDTIKPFIATAYSYDDNLLRLPDGVEGQGGGRGDTARQIQAGFLFNRPIGRQVLSGQAKWSKVSFKHFKDLDYDGKDFLADWEWHLANHLQGHLGASYNQTLTPFSDFQSSERNLRVQRRDYFDVAWRFHPSWRVRGALSHESYNYDLSTQRFNNRSENAAEVGGDYLASSDSRIGFQVRHSHSVYQQPRLIEAAFVEDSFDQDEAKANIYWYFSGITQLEFIGGWATRRYAFLNARDASGLNARTNLYWAPLGKLRFTGSAWREFSVVESVIFNNSLNQGVSLGATWDATGKIRVDASVRREKRDFNGSGVAAAGGDVSDRGHGATLGFSYVPYRQVQLGVSVFVDVRDGSPIVGTNSFHAKGASVNASVQF
ncbi:XrtB/PEP-CTERM-associated polysaccharide biosynthesis outer membrane protein EpsL [Janthinobacterium agaricidamnosum]|uniref:Exopolysaccharide biosynthesis operon protein EpsL n=1 Tax=Janthinobacterium agaricidamnosum NBRC 102515 = DSM 9628 TaxID=1349767 RepID=W0V9P5_9BURK|nr:XrtB/PEP-CTERM-associated polysaccharide biosynthesis outer membrane protein EpsL [Janthinobacterium agaricidamnosum]CDG84616.1 hypothetical protein GJA_4005 [Janthinobacterium agaricidamnosum NBRC 102515 = DSM 9628]